MYISNNNGKMENSLKEENTSTPNTDTFDYSLPLNTTKEKSESIGTSSKSTFSKTYYDFLNTTNDYNYTSHNDSNSNSNNNYDIDECKTCQNNEDNTCYNICNDICDNINIQTSTPTPTSSQSSTSSQSPATVTAHSNTDCKIGQFSGLSLQL